MPLQNYRCEHGFDTYVTGARNLLDMMKIPWENAAEIDAASGVIGERKRYRTAEEVAAYRAEIDGMLTSAGTSRVAEFDAAVAHHAECIRKTRHSS
jgi:hypothetical protein